MKQIRQDAWSEEEDALLAKIVLDYITHGHTQIEAFKAAGEQLKRTAAACGFRWNASLREKHEAAIKEARTNKETKQRKRKKRQEQVEDEHLIASAISLLEKIKPTNLANQEANYQEKIIHLQEENDRLKKQLVFYEQAWQEIGKIWQWSQEQEV